jgi:hypothetical protein
MKPENLKSGPCVIDGLQIPLALKYGLDNVFVPKYMYANMSIRVNVMNHFLHNIIRFLSFLKQK